MLYLYRRVVFGTITRDDVRRMTDLSWREICVFAPIVVLVLWMGIYPSSFLKPMQPALANLVEQVSAAQHAALLSAPTAIASR
jgi:NADH-quinone oxidoreductase subunit M